MKRQSPRQRLLISRSSDVRNVAARSPPIVSNEMSTTTSSTRHFSSLTCSSRRPARRKAGCGIFQPSYEISSVL